MTVQITAGQGTPIATDTLGNGDQAQYVKLLDASAGSSTPVAPLTDAQLRAAAVPVSGTVNVGNLPATQPVSAAALPLPSNAAKESTQLETHGTGGASIPAKVQAVGGSDYAGTPLTQLLKVDASGQIAVANFPATQPVSGPVTDAQLRASALPVSLASVPAHNVAVTNFPGTQPVSLATNTPDVTDRAARLLGHVTVDVAPTTAVTGTFWQATQPVSGPLTDAQMRASAVPVSDGRLPATLKTLPAGADGLAALPVYITAVLLLSYDAAARNLSSGALVANTAKQVLSIEHGAAAVKTVKIRRIMVGGLQTAAVAGMVDIQITKGTAASSAGTVVTPNQRKGGDAASEAVVKSLPTIVAATLGDTIPWGATAATANTPMPTMLVYDWQEGGETKPLQLRAGVLESIVVNVISTAAQALTMTVSVDFTEE